MYSYFIKFLRKSLKIINRADSKRNAEKNNAESWRTPRCFKRYAAIPLSFGTCVLSENIRTQNNYSCAFLIAAKHSLQYTGLSLLGWKGTVASLPH